MKIYPLFDDILSNDFDLIDFYKISFSNTYQLYKNEEYYELLKIIDQNLTEKPENALMWAYKGYILYKLSYFSDGLKCVEISLNIDDLIDFTWLLKAIILKNNNKINESLICYKEFVVLKYDENIDMAPVNIKTKVIDIEVNPNPRYDFKGQFDNVYKTKEELFSLSNIENFKINQISNVQYKELLNKIIDTAREIFSQTLKNNFINFNTLSTVDKIIIITKSFVNVTYKSDGEELGEYVLNSIEIDDRLFDANKITTIIHELSHHLIAEILEQMVMLKLNCEKTEVIEEVIYEFLLTDDCNLMDEYCAHAVEGRFTPHGYQNYASYNELNSRLSIRYNSSYLNLLIQLGYTFSKDILFIIESFITEELKQDIFQQFKVDIRFKPDYEDIKMECREMLSDNEKLDTMNSLLEEFISTYKY